jgi:uncharacterized membrane protein
VNIPVARFESKNILNAKTVQFCGMRYYLPKINQRKETILAINLGGAIIPSGLSLYLIFNNALFTQAFIAISVVAILVNRIAFRVKGVGIAVPTIAPPIIALLTASLVAPESTAPVAYISGTLGTLIGADLMNLYGLDELSAPVVSIGGAGTSDGIFLTGIIAVLLA